MNKLAKKPLRLWGPEDWRNAMMEGWLIGLDGRVLERMPHRMKANLYATIMMLAK